MTGRSKRRLIRGARSAVSKGTPRARQSKRTDEGAETAAEAQAAKKVERLGGEGARAAAKGARITAKGAWKGAVGARRLHAARKARKEAQENVRTANVGTRRRTGPLVRQEDAVKAGKLRASQKRRKEVQKRVRNSSQINQDAGFAVQQLKRSEAVRSTRDRARERLSANRQVRAMDQTNQNLTGRRARNTMSARKRNVTIRAKRERRQFRRPGKFSGRTYLRTKKQIDAVLKQRRTVAVGQEVLGAGIRGVVRAIISGVKAALAAAKMLAMVIAAAGSAVMVLMAIVVVIIGIMASSFGIFLSNEDSGSGMTMQTAIAAINQEYIDCIKAIQLQNQPYDSVNIYGTKPAWKDVLAVYAVLTTTDPDNATDVATMDEAHQALLSDLFWEMTSVTSSRSSSTSTVSSTVEVIDETTGQPTGETTTVYTEVTTTILTVTVTSLTAEDMIAQRNMTADQQEQLVQLLDVGNDDLWADLLGGYSGSTGTLEGTAAEIAQYLLGQGFTVEATAAVLGNLRAESGMDPNSDVVMDGMFNYKYERACGLFQYTHASNSSPTCSTCEYHRFKNWCQANGLAWNTVEAQMEWTFGGASGYGGWSSRWLTRLAGNGYYSNCPGYELTGGLYDATTEEFMSETDIAKAAYSWMACYERPANGSYAHLDRRISYALEFYEAMLTTAASNLIWPSDCTTISSYFGNRESPGGIGSTNHKGVDIAAEAGSNIYAAAGGTVTVASYSDSAGWWIKIDHGNGLCTVYMHCSELYVASGQEVGQGETIAAVGSTGNSTGPHLHFGVMVNGEYVNPLDYVSAG